MTTLTTITSSNQLENLLQSKAYKGFKPTNWEHLSESRKANKNAVEGVVSYGKQAVNAFEDLTAKLGRIPTATEFIKYCLPFYESYWNENRYKSNKINGRAINITVKQAMADRINRTYNSKIVELHTELILKEMGYKVYTNNYVDTYMGVDLVAESGRKRYYIHITSSPKGKGGAIQSVAKKEKRNKYYPRDFSGDVILCYDRLGKLKDDSTKFINNIPLLKRTHIDNEMFLAEISSKHGEALDAVPTKLDYFKDWMKCKHNIDVVMQ